MMHNNEHRQKPRAKYSWPVKSGRHAATLPSSSEGSSTRCESGEDLLQANDPWANNCARPVQERRTGTDKRMPVSLPADGPPPSSGSFGDDASV